MTALTEFMGAHPILTVILALLFCATLHDTVGLVCGRHGKGKSDSGSDDSLPR